jgi:hypothetical protein
VILVRVIAASVSSKLLANIVLSGFMFPWEAMPAPARWLSLAFPLTH